MAVLNLYLAPSFTKLSFTTLCKTHSFRHYYEDNKGQLQGVSGRHGNKVAPMFFASLKEFRRALPTVQYVARTEDVVVYLGQPHLALRDATLAVLEDISIKTLHRTLAVSLKSPRMRIESMMTCLVEDGSRERLAEASMGNSVMHFVQTQMYRVPLVDRGDVKLSVFRYLAGGEVEFGKAGQFPAIVSMLVEPCMLNLRNASVYARTHGVPAAVIKFSVDSFDLKFLSATAK
mgnify:FL=1